MQLLQVSLQQEHLFCPCSAPSLTITPIFHTGREHETKFLVRTLVSNLRVGANWRSVIGAMARAVVLHREGPRVSKARLDAAATAASEAFHVSVCNCRFYPHLSSCAISAAAGASHCHHQNAFCDCSRLDSLLGWFCLS